VYTFFMYVSANTSCAEIRKEKRNGFHGNLRKGNCECGRMLYIFGINDIGSVAGRGKQEPENKFIQAGQATPKLKETMYTRIKSIKKPTFYVQFEAFVGLD